MTGNDEKINMIKYSAVLGYVYDFIVQVLFATENVYGFIAKEASRHHIFVCFYIAGKKTTTKSDTLSAIFLLSAMHSSNLSQSC